MKGVGTTYGGFVQKLMVFQGSRKRGPRNDTNQHELTLFVVFRVNWWFFLLFLLLFQIHFLIFVQKPRTVARDLMRKHLCESWGLPHALAEGLALPASL